MATHWVDGSISTCKEGIRQVPEYMRKLLRVPSDLLQSIEAWLREGMPTPVEVASPEFQEEKRRMLMRMFAEKVHHQIAKRHVPESADAYDTLTRSNLESTLELAMTMAIQLGPPLIAYHLARSNQTPQHG